MVALLSLLTRKRYWSWFVVVDLSYLLYFAVDLINFWRNYEEINTDPGDLQHLGGWERHPDGEAAIKVGLLLFSKMFGSWPKLKKEGYNRVSLVHI